MGESGVAMLSKRIRKQFQQRKHCKESGLTFSTSYRMPGQAFASTQLPTEDRADEMAARIEDLIKYETLAGAVHHEQ